MPWGVGPIKHKPSNLDSCRHGQETIGFTQCRGWALSILSLRGIKSRVCWRFVRSMFMPLNFNGAA